MTQRIKKDRKELLKSVNSLQDANRKLRETQWEMVHTEKLISVGRLAAGMAHEIGNPVSIVQGYIDLMGQDNFSKEERQDFRSRAASELQRISSLIHQMLDLSRSSAGKSQLVHAQAILNELVEVIQTYPLMANIKIVTQTNTDFDQLWCNPEQLRQVLLNCLLNATDAIASLNDERQGVIEVITETVTRETDNHPENIYIIMIRDNGIGISPEKLDTIFDPFFTTKDPGKGTGLGLFVSHSIMERFGGKMRAESQKEQGSTIIIEMPLYHGETAI